jgi:hypothetical protein
MKDAWGEASALVAFTGGGNGQAWKNFWWKVLWTIVLGLNPIVGTFYVLQTTFVCRKFFEFIRNQDEAPAVRYEIARAMADTWVAVGVADATSIIDYYRLNPGQAAVPGQEAVPDPDLVLNLAGTVRAGIRQWPITTVEGPGPTQQQPPPPQIHFILLNYRGMLALLHHQVLDTAYDRQLQFLGRRTSLETGIIILQSMSYITAVVYRRIQHLKVSPIEGIGFAGSLLFLVYTSVQLCFGSISKKGLLIYLTEEQEANFPKRAPGQQGNQQGNQQPEWDDGETAPGQQGNQQGNQQPEWDDGETAPGQQGNQQPEWDDGETAPGQQGNQQPEWDDGADPDLRAFFWTFVVGILLAVGATILVWPVLAKKNTVDMLGHIIFFGDFLLQFIFLILYFYRGFGDRLTPNLLLTPLLFSGIIASAGVALAMYATIRHWHDQSFDIPTPSIGRYLPFIR